MPPVKPSNRDLLTGSLLAAQALYSTKHVQSKAAHDEACKYMPGGNTRTVLYTSPFPLTIASAESCYITTLDGHRYIDFLGDFTAGIYGHNHASIRAAIEKALDSGWSYGGQSRAEGDLARVLCERFPAVELVRFVNSGTEANMLALATAVAFTKRRKIVLFEKGYHGSTISGRSASASLGGSINLPHEFVVCRYNDTDGTKRTIEQLPSDSLAAILVEPVMGSAGCYAGTQEFLSTLRDLATQTGAVLIFDEVMTSRLSYRGYGDTLGIKADMMTLGKWVGGGLSFGAFGGCGEIMQLYDPRTARLEHPGTFNNNVFSMTAGIAGCRLLTESRLAELNQLGDSMRVSAEAILHSYQLSPKHQGATLPDSPIIDPSFHEREHPVRPPKIYIKGVGSMMCIHFAGPEREQLQSLFYLSMLQQGIYLAQRGFMALSIEIRQCHVDLFLRAFDLFLGQFFEVLKW